MTLTLAIPSKGRMKEDVIEALQRIGIAITPSPDARSYRTGVSGIEGLEVVLLSASEIARELAAGTIDLGVTGEDLVRETIPDADARIEMIARLGFGQADVVVAVPEAWIDVETMEDLNDVAASFRQKHHRRMRIATKYQRLTQGFFSRGHGIQSYRIVESLGATEGAPAAGSADIIVDITSTGSTLKANRLKVLSDGLILASQACLVLAIRHRPADDDAAIATLRSRFR
ncbi:MAG: ATP phosphoribosyltransferase [Rhizobiaceae bacterium]|nr:ATP phosphoribosyltransferase [Rhizobiaceae bacterium]